MVNFLSLYWTDTLDALIPRSDQCIPNRNHPLHSPNHLKIGQSELLTFLLLDVIFSDQQIKM